MGVLGQIVSTLADVFNSLVDAAFSRPPVGLLVVTLAILAVSMLPEDKREKARIAAMAAIGLIVMVKIFWPSGWSGMPR
jgi:hypothetical protein